MILFDINVPSLPQYCTSPRGDLTVVKAWKLPENSFSVPSFKVSD